jgi:ribosomal protein S18 acetylase RimI-like enzyme
MSKASITVRAARRRDLPQIIDLGAALARHVGEQPPAWTTQDLERLAFGRNRWCDMLVAVSGGGVVGVAVLGRMLQLHEGKQKLYLADLSIAPEAKGLGAGRALMAAIARRALEVGAGSVFWEVWVENEEAFRFYERLGASRDDAVVSMMSLDEAGLRRLLRD